MAAHPCTAFGCDDACTLVQTVMSLWESGCRWRFAGCRSACTVSMLSSFLHAPLGCSGAAVSGAGPGAGVFAAFYVHGCAAELGDLLAADDDID